MAQSLWQKVKENIRLGKEGHFRGIPMGLPKVSNLLCNIQKGRYDLIGGAPGTGKSAFVDTNYVMRPLQHIMNDPDPFFDLEIIYFSLEIAPERKIAKLLSTLIYEEHKMLSSYNEIYSMGNLNINPQIESLIDDYEDRFENLIDNKIFFHTAASPNYMYKVLLEYFEKRGSVVWKNQKEKILDKYIPHNPKLITVCIIDHLGLLTGNKGDSSQKGIIDRTSRMLVFFRNNFGLSPVPLSQFNRSIEGMDRRRENQLEPQLSDFKETGNSQEDADTVMALFYPYKYGLDKHRGYKIMGDSAIEEYYRSLHILKNRDGRDSLATGLFFQGATGYFKELPTPEEIEQDHTLWDRVMNRKREYENLRV